jgi:hypothetical protein
LTSPPAEKARSPAPVTNRGAEAGADEDGRERQRGADGRVHPLERVRRRRGDRGRDGEDDAGAAWLGPVVRADGGGGGRRRPCDLSLERIGHRGRVRAHRTDAERACPVVGALGLAGTGDEHGCDECERRGREEAWLPGSVHDGLLSG